MPHVPHARPIAAVVLIAGVSAALWLLLSPSAAVLRAVPSRSADAFVDSVGVNIHTTYDDTSYARRGAIRARLRELGVRHVRQGLDLSRPDEYAELQRLAAQGQRTTVISFGPAPLALAAIRARLRGAVEAVESPNELDNLHLADWPRLLGRFLPVAREQLRAVPPLSVPLLGPSLVHPGSRKTVAGLAHEWDVTNLHPYPGGQPPEDGIADALRFARRVEGRKPVMATESGYHDALNARSGQPPVSEQAAAVYIPRLVLEYFRLGIVRTFLYELADEKPDPGLVDPEQHFGLLRSDLSPKPAFIALRRLIATAAGRGTTPAHDVPRVRTDAADAGVREVLLRRDDGSCILALWRPAPVWLVAARRPVTESPVQVRIGFSAPPHEVTVSHPSLNAETRSLTPARTLSLPVGADVTLLAYG